MTKSRCLMLRVRLRHQSLVVVCCVWLPGHSVCRPGNAGSHRAPESVPSSAPIKSGSNQHPTWTTWQRCKSMLACTSRHPARPTCTQDQQSEFKDEDAGKTAKDVAKSLKENAARALDGIGELSTTVWCQQSRRCRISTRL